MSTVGSPPTPGTASERCTGNHTKGTTMTATIVFKSGNQYRVDPEAVDRMVREYNVTSKRTNGAQTQFNFNDAEYPFSIVANNYSEAYEALENAHKRYRKESRTN